MLLAYALGIFFMLLPEIYQKNIRGYNEKEFIQSQSLPNGYKLICSNQTQEQSQLRHDTVLFTMRAIGSICLLFIGLFKIIQGKINAPYLWIELKATNNTLSGAMAGSLFMF